MKSTKARLREVTDQIAHLGLKIIEQRLTGSNHYRLLLEREDGERMIFIASLSPSDKRAALNNLTLIKRFVRGVPV